MPDPRDDDLRKRIEALERSSRFWRGFTLAGIAVVGLLLALAIAVGGSYWTSAERDRSALRAVLERERLAREAAVEREAQARQEVEKTKQECDKAIEGFEKATRNAGVEDVLLIRVSDGGVFLRDPPWVVMLFPDGRAELTVWGRKERESTFNFDKSKFDELVRLVRAPRFVGLPDAVGRATPDGFDATVEVVRRGQKTKRVRIRDVFPGDDNELKKAAEPALEVWLRIHELVGDRAKSGLFGP